MDPIRTLEPSADPAPPAAAAQRLRVEVRGAVQGVGFRPFVYRLARELELAGWVLNDSRGVTVEVEGTRERLEAFSDRLRRERPPRAVVHGVRTRWSPPRGEAGFVIRHSARAGAKRVVVLPDVATCPACLAEVLDPADRRHRYPFTNCTDCGPRFTIVRSLPYDRPGTTMAGFALCPDCRREYEDPADRRFHAQPNACPRCGPRLSLWAPGGDDAAGGDDALTAAAAALRRGEIVAVKGLGGFHLMADAGDGAAVARLRRRKGREEKPFALMVADLAAAGRLCRLDAAAAAVLAAPECPIVLLPARDGNGVAPAVAPGRPDLGVMLPPSPLHHLLLAAVGRPVVATSGNVSDEPIATDETDARERLGHIADLFLVHDRPIARHADDSVVRCSAGAPRLLRRARGWAPLPVLLPVAAGGAAPTVLAVGAHLKNAVTLLMDGRAFVSQHLGDMETPRACAAFERVIADFLDLYEAAPAALAHDLHPDLPTTRWAQAAARGEGAAALRGRPLVAVQHHHAHLAACLAENRAAGPALGVTWDGTGYGTDGTVWGGELLLGDLVGFARVARLRPFRLPGGDVAAREPRRAALALVHALRGAGAPDDLPLGALPATAFTPSERRLLERMLAGGVRSPWTTSAGRLFDGVAALAGLASRSSYEGQAAMALEAAADPGEEGVYPYEIAELPAPPPPGAAGERPAPGGRLLELDWRPLVAAVLEDVRRGRSAGTVAARFHNSLGAAVADLVVRVAARSAIDRVALSGGCFQNVRLTEDLVRRLGRLGFEVLLHREVPPNDGGVSLGQAAVAAARLARDREDASCA